jgi:beta-lactam-binding protein with PASTA domain
MGTKFGNVRGAERSALTDVHSSQEILTDYSNRNKKVPDFEVYSGDYGQ